jgi:hypothetical protein
MQNVGKLYIEKPKIGILLCRCICAILIPRALFQVRHIAYMSELLHRERPV